MKKMPESRPDSQPSVEKKRGRPQKNSKITEKESNTKYTVFIPHHSTAYRTVFENGIVKRYCEVTVNGKKPVDVLCDSQEEVDEVIFYALQPLLSRINQGR